MKLVIDNPLFGLLLDHKLEFNAFIEEIWAFLIIGSPIDTVPEFCLFHANRIHGHACNATVLLHKPGLCRVAVEAIDDLDSIMVTSNFQLGPGQFSVIEEQSRSVPFIFHKLTRLLY